MNWPWSGDGHAARGLSDEENERLKREQVAYIISEVWPETPQPALRRRTPLQAGQAGDSETFLRASIRRRWSRATSDRRSCSTGTSCARSFTLNPEPPIDPDTVDIDRASPEATGVCPRRPAG